VRKYVARSVVALAALVMPLAAQQGMKDAPDYSAMVTIRAEAIGNQTSQVMKTLSFLTDVYGGRLTGSTNAKLAADWSMQQMKDWGLANVHLEPWDFGKGWVNERMSANVVSPVSYPLIAYPLAWTPGTHGPVTAEVTIVNASTDEEIAKLKGTLKGKVVMVAAPRDIPMSTEPLAKRYTDQELAELSQQTIQGAGRGGAAPAFNALTPQMQAQAQRMQAELNWKLNKLFVEEGVVAVFQSSRGDGGTVFVQSAAPVTDTPPAAFGAGGGGRGPQIHAYDKTTPKLLNQVVLAAEHYNRIYRTIQNGVPVSVELNIQNKWLDGDGNSFDIVGEIPGSDPALADQVVMVGAHFDSWHSGTGATDNGVGSAVMLEVMRVLKATGLKMRRTVRIGLWTGEEEGLLGSRAYVANHFGNAQTQELKQPEHKNFDVYFNIDNGSGKLRGVYLQGNEAAAPIFEQWMKPFHDMGMTTLSIDNTGGTDHLSFDAVGLPGFQFIQDPLEYDTRTHHSNMDLYDRVQAADLKQMAAVVSTFVYQAANRDEQFPRKPQPKPAGGRRGGM